MKRKTKIRVYVSVYALTDVDDLNEIGKHPQQCLVGDTCSSILLGQFSW